MLNGGSKLGGMSCRHSTAQASKLPSSPTALIAVCLSSPCSPANPCASQQGLAVVPSARGPHAVLQREQGGSAPPPWTAQAAAACRR